MAKGGKFTKLMKKLSFGKSSSKSQHNPGAPHAVYVGHSRRQYNVPFEVIEHPIFQKLIGESTEDGEIMVGCEVVLFDHLLWMLENVELKSNELSSFDELVGYYAC